ncbi:hypothetical protein FHG87_008065 [Trinorchestia longiramus]|nr:hypothetical protein FHG87_008065 [Trinorchestia longiramus]
MHIHPTDSTLPFCGGWIGARPDFNNNDVGVCPFCLRRQATERDWWTKDRTELGRLEGSVRNDGDAARLVSADCKTTLSTKSTIDPIGFILGQQKKRYLSSRQCLTSHISTDKNLLGRLFQNS